MHKTLYLKYRPQNFDEVEGQVHVKCTLRSAAKLGKISHAYIFYGPRGTGKTTMARIVAKALNCTSMLPDGNPCNICPTCMEISEGSLVDVIEIDAASNRGIDEIRALKERIHFAPTVAKTKVYIIDEVHMLSKDAANALLKTLEEPPQHVHFILATTEIHKIIPTILSRCQRHTFLPLEVEDIITRLQYVCSAEKIDAEEAALNIIAKKSHGGMRDSLTLLEQLIHGLPSLTTTSVRDFLGLDIEEHFEALLSALHSKDIELFQKSITALQQQGLTGDVLLRNLRDNAREQMLTSFAQKKAPSKELVDLARVLDENLLNIKHVDIPLFSIELLFASYLTSEHTVNKPQVSIDKPKIAPAEVDNSTSTPASKSAPSIPKKVIPAKKNVQKAPREDSLENTIKSNWISLCFKIIQPTLKSWLSRQAKPISLQDGTLTIQLLSEKLAPNIDTKEHRESISELLQREYDKEIVVKFAMPETLASEQPESSPPKVQENVKEPTLPPKDDIDTIASFFGGTVT